MCCFDSLIIQKYRSEKTRSFGCRLYKILLCFASCWLCFDEAVTATVTESMFLTRFEVMLRRQFFYTCFDKTLRSQCFGCECFDVIGLMNAYVFALNMFAL